MYTLIKAQGLRRSLIAELPAALSALVVAEVFYKFHSFSLECLAFMATWFVFGWVLSYFEAGRRKIRGESSVQLVTALRFKRIVSSFWPALAMRREAVHKGRHRSTGRPSDDAAAAIPLAESRTSPTPERTLR